MENNKPEFKPFIVYPKSDIIIKPFAVEGDIGIELNYHPQFYFEHKNIQGVICYGEDECEICNVKKEFLIKHKDNSFLINHIFKVHKFYLNQPNYHRIILPISIYTTKYNYTFYYGIMPLYITYAINFTKHILSNDLLTIASTKDKRLLKVLSKDMTKLTIIDDHLFRFIPDNIKLYEMFLSYIKDKQSLLSLAIKGLNLHTDVKHYEIYTYYIKKLIESVMSF